MCIFYMNKLSQVINKFICFWPCDYLQSLWEKHYSPKATSSCQPRGGEDVIAATELDRSKWSLG